MSTHTGKLLLNIVTVQYACYHEHLSYRSEVGGLDWVIVTCLDKFTV